MSSLTVKGTRADSVVRFLAPPAVAELLGISAEKVISWIERGELRASNVANRTSSRPRWRISPEALEDFLRAREVSPAVKPLRRRVKERSVKEYF